MQIVNYTPAYYDRLWAYIQEKWPNRKKEYLDFRLFQLTVSEAEVEQNILAVNEKDEIVGVNLFIPATALIKGKVERIAWSHDTVVDESYRGDLSTLLICQVRMMNHVFGFGLSEVNKKIQLKLKTRFIAEAYRYFLFNRRSYQLPFYKYIKTIKPKNIDFNKFPSMVSVSSSTFQRIYTVGGLNIPSNGCWYGGCTEFEFMRDEKFIDDHFFKSFKQYFFYKLLVNKDRDECYFVVRPTVQGGLSKLLLVDYRYNHSKPDQLSSLLKASRKLAISLKIPVVEVLSTQELKLYTHGLFLYKKNKPVNLVANSFFKVGEKVNVLATYADSDLDYID